MANDKSYYRFCAPIVENVNQQFEQLVKSQKAPIVFTNGCFDLIHAGHIRLLNLAGVFGWLVVGLNSDESIRKLKGPARPVQTFEDRALALASIRAVQSVVRFDTARCDRLIGQIRPSIYELVQYFGLQLQPGSGCCRQVCVRRAAGRQIGKYPAENCSRSETVVF